MVSHKSLGEWDDAMNIFHWMRTNRAVPSFSSHKFHYWNKSTNKAMFMPVQNIRLYTTALDVILDNVRSYKKGPDSGYNHKTANRHGGNKYHASKALSTFQNFESQKVIYLNDMHVLYF